MPLEPAHEWLEKAREDEATALLLQTSGRLWSVAAFHLQQSAEKMIKAVIVYRGVLPPRTHDLGTLISQINDPIASQAVLDSAARLSPFSWQTRYPGVDPLNESEFDSVRADFQLIKDWIAPLVPGPEP